MTRCDEHKDVQKCLQLIEEKLNWGPSVNWHSDVFIELSSKIQEETKILLSPTTLKRVWGKVSYNSSPSISTLNTLAQFAGFLNWRDFKNKYKVSKSKKYQNIFSANFRVIALSAFIISLFFFSVFSMSSDKTSVKPDYSNLTFSSRPITSGLPNSVVFNFDLKEVVSNDILIQQYWDATKTIKIDKNQKQATGQYYFPGYFRAKLLIDKEIIKEHDLFIKSKGWLGTIDYNPVPKYIIEEKIKSENDLSFSDEITSEIVQNKEPITSTFHYVDDLGEISGDDFELKANIKNIFTEKWGVCQKTTIVIVGTKSAMLIPFSIPGCVSEIGVMLSDVYLNGKKNDLSAFGVNFSESKDISIRVEDKKVEVYVDKQLLFTSNYIDSLGNLVGVRFKFQGVGTVRNMLLTDLKGKTFLSL